jgi:hypothetical protein
MGRHIRGSRWASTTPVTLLLWIIAAMVVGVPIVLNAGFVGEERSVTQ